MSFERECDCNPWNPAHERGPIRCCICGDPATHYVRHEESGPAIAPQNLEGTPEGKAMVLKMFEDARKTFSITGAASCLDICHHVTCEKHKDAPHHVAVTLAVAYPAFFGSHLAHGG